MAGAYCKEGDLHDYEKDGYVQEALFVMKLQQKAKQQEEDIRQLHLKWAKEEPEKRAKLTADILHRFDSLLDQPSTKLPVQVSIHEPLNNYRIHYEPAFRQHLARRSVACYLVAPGVIQLQPMLHPVPIEDKDAALRRFMGPMA